MAFDDTKPNKSQTIGEVIEAANANDKALKEEIGAHTRNGSAHGLDDVQKAVADHYAHKADSTTAHGIGETNAQLAAMVAEITAGRGTQGSLAARLIAALNGDGTIKLSTLNNKWINNADTPSFVDSTHLTVPGDRTRVYIGGIQLRLTVSGSYVYAPVASSSYGGGVTTITLDPAYQLLTAGLSAVDIGLIAWDNAVAQACTQNAAAIANVQGQVTGLKIVEVADKYLGKPAAGAIIGIYVAQRAFSIPAGATNSLLKSRVAANASAALTLAKSGAAFGTATFAAAGQSATFAVATAVSVAAGDLITITAPSSQDATLADLVWNLQGVLP